MPVEEPKWYEERWRGRPVLAVVVRALTIAVPLVLAVTAGISVGRALRRPTELGWTLVWGGLVLVVSTLVLTITDRAARRLLPLAALLKLSMVFPDKAPSRYSIAVRAGTIRHLQERLQEARERGIDDEPAKAAADILTLAGALNAHDRRTRGHSERVRAFTDLLAEELKLPAPDHDRLRWAALLHDVGKLHVPTRILNKPSAPTQAEWVALKKHPTDGSRMARGLSEWLGPWSLAIEEHHERWDGGGYPHGRAGEDITLGARIVAVADAFEVMTGYRPYQRPVSAAAGREELSRCAGSHFDPAVVRAFLNISIGRIRWVMGPMAWVAQIPFLGAVPQWEGAAAAIGTKAATLSAATGMSAMAITGAVQAPSRPAPPAGIAAVSQTSPGGYAVPAHATPAAPAPATQQQASMDPAQAAGSAGLTAHVRAADLSAPAATDAGTSPSTAGPTSGPAPSTGSPVTSGGSTAGPGTTTSASAPRSPGPSQPATTSPAPRTPSGQATTAPTASGGTTAAPSAGTTTGGGAPAAAPSGTALNQSGGSSGTAATAPDGSGKPGAKPKPKPNPRPDPKPAPPPPRPDPKPAPGPDLDPTPPPGLAGQTPGQSGALPPGLSGATPGQSGAKHDDDGGPPPGRAATTPGQSAASSGGGHDHGHLVTAVVP